MDSNDPKSRPTSPGAKDADDEQPTPTVNRGSRMKRRDFLHAGVLGAAGAATFGGTGALAGEAEQRRPGGGAGQGRGGGAGPAPPTSDVSVVVAGDPETWNEPWVWRPPDWPGQQLHLNVVENQSPSTPVGLGNPGGILFSYGGDTPGPTIRMKGDETLFVKLRNLLGQDFGQTFVGPFPNDAPGDATQSQAILDKAEEKATALGNHREDFCLGEHANGVHSIRVTNLHTHGLHVRPSRNPNGTHSDNVILRVLSQADLRRREQLGPDAACPFQRAPEELYSLRDDETAGEANYEFRLGNVQQRQRQRDGKPPQPHPAGTFWYHPHAHGATHNQVASGMAGFLLVEGDIEDAINREHVNWTDGTPEPDPSVPSGPYDYRERLMLMQRALNLSEDKDSRTRRQQSGMSVLVNGGSTPAVITMRPGAIERWRVLNGSVDGRGYKRIMVVKGQYTVQNVGGNLHTFQVSAQGQLTNLAGQVDQPFTLAELETLERRKQDLYQLSVDGVTLVRQDGETPRYVIKDLSRQGIEAGTTGNSPDDMRPNPLWSYEPQCAAALRSQLDGTDPLVKEGADLTCRLFNVWADADNVRNCFVRWNEFYMGPANRTDLFFQAPALSSDSPTRTVQNPEGTSTTTRYEVYTVLAKTVVVHSDTPQFVAQRKLLGQSPGAPSPEDVIVAYVLVDVADGIPEPAVTDMRSLMTRLEGALPPVQEYLHPIVDTELRATDAEAAARPDVRAGDFRTRRVLYSGWGHPSMPLVTTYPLRLTDPPQATDPPTARAFVDYINNDPVVTLNGTPERTHENLIYAAAPDAPDYYVLMPPAIRTMAISVNNARTEFERQQSSTRDAAPFLHPDLPRKFDPTDPYRARMLEDTAEEWSLYNLTNPLWADTSDQPPTQYGSHYVAHPMSRREGQRRFLADQNFQLVGRGIDHPFHVHQNPFWVTRIEIPDANGDLVDVLDGPRWMDSIWIPRGRGRVVFRMRFPDFVGAYVHHCHILLHEDNGMMHVIEATPFADQSNYEPSQVLDADRNAPRPTPEESFTVSYQFYDLTNGMASSIRGSP